MFEEGRERRTDRLEDEEAAKDVHLDLADLKKKMEEQGDLETEEEKEGARKIVEQFALEKGVHGRQIVEDKTQ